MYPAKLSPVDADGRLTLPLAQFCRLFGHDPDKSLVEVANELMAHFVTPDVERWNEPEVVLDEEQLREFWEIIRTLDMYEALLPNLSEYDNALVLGGTLKPQDRKNAFLVELMDFVKIGHIFHIGGDRELDPARDSIALLGETLPGGLVPQTAWQRDLPWETETDMVRYLWLRSQLPESVRAVPCDFVGAAATTGHRGNSVDGYSRWLDEFSFTSGRVLIVTIAPHAQFQAWDAVHRFVGDDYDFEIDVVAAPATYGSQDLKYFTGAIARWLRSYLRVKSGVDVTR